VAFYPTMTVPNFFTPNGDMVNDRLDIVSDNADELHQRIYNRWGQLVYESYLPDESWDGTFNGAPVAAGVYFLEIEVSNAYSQEREIVVRHAVHVMR
ncbi:MAG: gliding motility-associated C-terminal domain-containing protein, partial [Schleiferiaceae bacterium]